MAKVPGKDMLLYKGTSPSGTLVAALRNCGFSINGQAIDVTDKGSAGWQELLAGGIRNATINISGLLDSSTTAMPALTDVIAGTIDDYYISFNGGDRISGKFMINSFNAKGGYQDAQEFDASLQSSGAITYTNV